MSYLVLDELNTTLDQVFTVPANTRIVSERIRPRIYIAQPSGLMGGSLKLSIMNDTATTTLDSLTQSMADIRTSGSTNLTDNYYYGHISFVWEKPIILQAGTYTLRLEGISGYTYSVSDYIGWIKDHEDIIVDIDGLPSISEDNPFSFEIYSYQMR